jgi:hypothetical protein
MVSRSFTMVGSNVIHVLSQRRETAEESQIIPLPVIGCSWIPYSIVNGMDLGREFNPEMGRG